MTPEQRIHAAGGAIVPFTIADISPKPSRFPLIWIDDVKPKLDSQYIVKGLLSSGALSVVYGESGSGKTFAALSLALHVALGWAWWELQTTQCGGLYIACEGGGGALNRVAAFKAYHPNYAGGLKVPFAMIAAPINLLDPDADVADLVECIRDAEKAIGRPIGLIVIDTLSRALAGGEENSSQDMGAFVANVDRIRAETGAHVLIVHHSGKDQARGARGHSLLRAATDTEIEVTADEATGIRRMVVKKQRDLPTDGEFAFRLISVDLGIDQDGDPVSSCVVEAVDADQLPAKSSKAAKVPAGATRALALLKSLIADHGSTAPTGNHIPPGVLVVTERAWRMACYAGQITESDNPEAQQKAFVRAAAALVNAGHVTKWNEYIWLS